ncbi:MAG: DDE-type integrase/transposase/recombinase [Sedimenticola sp.]
MTDSKLERKLSSLYYSPRGYWKGLAAIKNLAAAAKVSENIAKDWLKKQAIWQIYLPAPRHVPRPKFDVPVPNEVQQADLLFLPHDRVGRKTYKYALTVVDVASRYKEAEPLATKEAKEVAAAVERIYTRSPLKWPKLLQVDPGREFMGAVSQLLADRGVSVRRGRVDVHRDQGIVERFNRTLSERLFGHQYAQEMLLAQRAPDQRAGERSVEWVARLPAVISALNNEVTRLTGKKPSDAIKAKTVAQKPSSVVPGRPVGLEEQKLPSRVGIRYLYQPGELEGGRRRATDPVWSLQVYRLGRSVTKPEEPVLYYLQDGPARGFVREELLVVPPDTVLPPDGVLTR